MTPQELDRIEALAQKQVGPEMTTPVVLGPGAVLKLVALARQALPKETQTDE